MPRQKSKQGFYRPGDYYVTCDASGFKVRRSDCKRTWDNRLVHRDYYEPRQPQDFVRGRTDKIAVDEARPEPDDQFLDTNEVGVEDL